MGVAAFSDLYSNIIGDGVPDPLELPGAARLALYVPTSPAELLGNARHGANDAVPARPALYGKIRSRQ